MFQVSVTIANERRKALPSAFYNLGSALAGAAAVKLYSDAEMTFAVILWSIGAIFLMFAGWMLLSLLEEEA